MCTLTPKISQQRVLVAIVRNHTLQDLEHLRDVPGALYAWHAFGFDGAQVDVVLTRVLASQAVGLVNKMSALSWCLSSDG